MFIKCVIVLQQPFRIVKHVLIVTHLDHHVTIPTCPLDYFYSNKWNELYHCKSEIFVQLYSKPTTPFSIIQVAGSNGSQFLSLAGCGS